MADEDRSSKTEEPTGKRLAEAKQKGQVARSMEIGHWATLLAAAGALVVITPWMMRKVSVLSVNFISDAHLYPTDFEHLHRLF